MAATTLLVGCGRLGSAILEGWRRTGALPMAELAILTPSDKPAAEAARAEGASINPDDLSAVRRLVLAVKPARWRTVAEALPPRLPERAVVVSVMAGVRARDLEAAFRRPVARVMPTTAVRLGAGAATVWPTDPTRAREAALELFAPLAVTVDVEDEALIDVATAVSGSGAAYVYAFAEALARAGEAQGLGRDQALALAEATASGALAMMTEADRSPAELIAEVASPGGTTEAGLKVLGRPDGLDSLVAGAVAAALRRARELAV